MRYQDFLKSDRPCPFCEGGQRAIAENETAILTYALTPYHPDHMLVVPKRHASRILEVSDGETRDIDSLLKLGLGKLKRLGYDSVTFLVREGESSGKSFDHLHHHVIPQIALGNADHAGADREVLGEEDVARLVARLKAAKASHWEAFASHAERRMGGIGWGRARRLSRRACLRQRGGHSRT